MFNKLAIIVITLALSAGCTVNPQRYGVTDKYGNVDCFAAGDYSVAQAMQDNWLLVDAVYRGNANTAVLAYLTSSVKAATIGYCVKSINSPKIEYALGYANSNARSLVSKSFDLREFTVDTDRAAKMMAVAYVTYYQQSLNLFVEGRQ